MSYWSLATTMALLREASCAPADENSTRRARLTPDGISGLVVGILGLFMMAFGVWIWMHAVRAAMRQPLSRARN